MPSLQFVQHEFCQRVSGVRDQISQEPMETVYCPFNYGCYNRTSFSNYSEDVFPMFNVSQADFLANAYVYT